MGSVHIEPSTALAKVGCPLASNFILAIQLALALPGAARGVTHSFGGWLHSDHLFLVFLFLRLSHTACQDMLHPGKPVSLWFTCHLSLIPDSTTLCAPNQNPTSWSPFISLYPVVTLFPRQERHLLFLYQLPVVGSLACYTRGDGLGQRLKLASFFFFEFLGFRHGTGRKCLQWWGHRCISPGAAGTCLYKSCCLGLPSPHCGSCLRTAPEDKSLLYTVALRGGGGAMRAKRKMLRWESDGTGLCWGCALVPGLHRKLIFYHRILWHGRESCYLDTLRAVSKPWAKKPSLANGKLWPLQGEQR